MCRKLMFLSCFVLALGIVGNLASAGVLSEYDANAGNPQSAANVQNPTEQGWVETGLGASVTVEGVVDNGTNAWRISDDASNLNPRYGWPLTADDFQAMYNHGWELVFVARCISAGFCGWGVTTGTDPGWGLTDRERVGFGITVAAANALQIAPIHGDTVVLDPGSADDFHTIRCVGAPKSSQYEFFIDGTSYGTYDIKDGGSNSNYDNIYRFVSGSTGGTGREAYWNYVALAAGMLASDKAYSPSPSDDSIYEQTWANLSWVSGDHAVSHDIYFGESFDDVNIGAESVFQGNQSGTFLVVGFPGFPIPAGLVPGTTYYWRIDEVNDLDPNSPWKGDVWSFLLPPRNAYLPDPIDGSGFIDTDLTLSWSAGFNTKSHHVYFGNNREEIEDAVGAMPQAETTYLTGTLELEKTYYWRVDEFDGIAMNKGEVWSFTTMPVIAVSEDPNLVALWTFDEGQGNNALDWSGHENHGTLFGPDWTAASLLGEAALDLDAGYVAIRNLNYASADLTEVTVSAWIRTNSPSDQYIVSFDRNEYYRLEINGSGAGPGQVGWDVMTSSGQLDYGSISRIDDGRWHHVCGVFDNGQATIFIDGVPEPSATAGSTFGSGNTRFGFIGANSEASSFNGSKGAGAPVAGKIDDVRIYGTALTQEEIVLVMRGDPLLAWAPSPADGSTPDLDNAVPLSWLPGDMVAQHDVYFGTERDAVKNADTLDTTGVYRGSQSGTGFTPDEGVKWGAGPFYWRIDENNTDGTVTTGRVWTFTVADFILVDDFESYTDNDTAGEAIWQHWIDGFDLPANGSQVGYVLPPYAEQTIVHGGTQSMPLLCSNTAGVRNSEAVLALPAPRDWTRHGVGTLSLWFRGYPPSVGSFTEGPAGTFTMTASGADIWGTSDQFHFAYRTLAGPGTIVARVDSVQNTHAWAKAGVMIRETLDPGSKHAFAIVSAGSGIASQGRTATDTSSFGTTEAGIAAPHWVKLERDAAGNFTVSHSANGSAWVQVVNSIPTNIPMASDVFVGLALTSHDNIQTCEAKFSNVSITGTVGTPWTSQDIGILGNDAEQLYVAVTDSAGASAVVSHDDVNAATIDVWTEWAIDLQRIADQGVNLTNVDKIAIGLGIRGNANVPSGSGTLFIDDIRLLRPEEEPQP